MSTLDILYIGIMVVALTVSSFRGGVREIFSLVAVVVGFVAASKFYALVSGQMLRLTSHEEVNNIISFIIIFVFIAVLTSYLGGQLSQLIKKVRLGFWNMMAGTAIGIIKGLFVCSLMTYVLLVFMKPDGGFFSESKAFPFVSQLTMTVSPIGPKDFRDELDKKLKVFASKNGPGAETPKKPEEAKPAEKKPDAVKDKKPKAVAENKPGDIPAKPDAETSTETQAQKSAEPAPEAKQEQAVKQDAESR